MDILNACNWRWFCWWRPCRGNTVRRHVDWLCSICTQKNRGTRMINHCCHLKNGNIYYIYIYWGKHWSERNNEHINTECVCIRVPGWILFYNVLRHEFSLHNFISYVQRTIVQSYMHNTKIEYRICTFYKEEIKITNRTYGFNEALQLSAR